MARTFVDFEEQLTGKVTNDVLQEIRNVVMGANGLQSHRLYLDGGKSFSEFWEMGNGLIRAAKGVAVRIRPPVPNQASLAPADVSGPTALSELEFHVLVAVGQRDRVTAREVASTVQLSEQKAKFYLDELSRKHRLVDWFGNMNPGGEDHYALTHEGRRVLVDRKVF
jgi:hypothetical protein